MSFSNAVSLCVYEENLSESSVMPETAEAVAATVTTRRNATIEITNLTNNYCLLNPK